MKLFTVVALMFALAAPALAQRGVVEVPARPVVINMEEDVIEGQLRGPDQLVMVRPGVLKFRTLIRMRTDFRKEVLASGAQL